MTRIVCIGPRVTGSTGIKSQMVKMSGNARLPIGETFVRVGFAVAVGETACVGHLKPAGIMKRGVDYSAEFSVACLNRRLTIGHDGIYSDFRCLLPINFCKGNKFTGGAPSSRPTFGRFKGGGGAAHYRCHAVGVFLSKYGTAQQPKYRKRNKQRNGFFTGPFHNKRPFPYI